MKLRYLITVICLLSISFIKAQTIEGKDYSALAKVDHTFDMAGDDIFGQRFPSENFTYKDLVTGVTVNALTTSRHHNSKMYQTHPQWTPDGKYLIFSSNRTATKEIQDRQFYAISMDDYTIVQITTGKNGRDFHLGWKKNLAYQFKDNTLIQLALGKLLEDSKKNNVKNPEEYEKIIAKIPDTIKPSGLGLDASETAAFFSTKLKEDKYAIYRVDFNTGVTKQVLEVPFRIGHLQNNPYIPNELMYCWETGGDSPQRMWYLKIDHEGNSANKPLYEEDANDWVTHEVFMGPDKVLFHLMGHINRLQKKTTGIYSINLKTNALTFHGQAEAGGYWHCNATPNGKWIVGDTFDGKLYRINAANTKDTTLLTTGHRLNSRSPFSKEAHMHQSVSPDGKWVLFNSSYFTENDIFIVPLFPETLKNK